MLGTCPNCEQPIHSLDGAVASGGKPLEHTDCAKAASIDYGIAFDILYQLACDMGYGLHAFMEESAGDEPFQETYDEYLTRAVSRASDMTAHRTYALARKGGLASTVRGVRT
jgi:hypothetical protein